jgi:hypothetical protein
MMKTKSLDSMSASAGFLLGITLAGGLALAADKGDVAKLDASRSV